MKKNAMLKIAAVLLVAVLLTTCAISSTFAKYATTGEHFTDGARVAKWGITVKSLATSTTGFKNNYTHNGFSVISSDKDLVIAPGTSGKIIVVFEAAGNPEVTGEVIVRAAADADSTDHEFLKVSTDLAERLTWKLNGQSSDIDAINDKIESWNQPFSPYDPTANGGKGNAVKIGETLEIEWMWIFEESGFDDEDTALGNNNEANTISLNIYADVVQTGPAVEGAK